MMDEAEVKHCEIKIESLSVTQTPVTTPLTISLKKRLALGIVGSSQQVNRAALKSVMARLHDISGDAAPKSLDIEQGNIRLILEGSSTGLDKIEALLRAGKLTQIGEMSLEQMPVLGMEATNEGEESRLDPLAALVQDILSQGGRGRDLRGVDLHCRDLSGANLSLADLSLADLSLTDLSLADLSLANLSLADLSLADLSLANLSLADLSLAYLKGTYLSLASLQGAYLRGADLRGADLRYANLSGAYLGDASLRGAYLQGTCLKGTYFQGASVENTRFGNNSGLSEAIKLNLIERGAIFEESPSDRAHRSAN
jgi:hypothetical protein